MKLLLVVDRYAPEARSVAHLFEDLAHELTKLGHATSVLTKQPTENLPGGPAAVPKIEKKNGVSIRRLASPLGEPRSTLLKALDQFYFAWRVFVRLVYRPRFDAVLVYSPPLPLAAACAAADVVRTVPFVVNLHDLYPRTAVELGRLKSRTVIGLARAVEAFVYRRARGLVVPSPESLVYLSNERRLPSQKLRLVYNWLDLEAIQPGNGKGYFDKHGLSEKFVVTYAGLVGVAQDLEAVISAARLAQDDDRIAFLIIGEGSELSRWKNDAQGLPNVVFLPTLPRDEYLRALRASNVGLIALSGKLRSPAIPGKLQSLMALAKPVVAVVPADSAAAAAVKESGCGFVTPPGNGAALLDAVQAMRREPALARELGEAGRRFAEKAFSLRLAAKEFELALTLAVSSSEKC